MSNVGGFIAKSHTKTSLLNRALGSHNGLNNFLNPGGRVLTNVSEGKALTARSLFDPAGVVLQAPPKAPPPPPVFPDMQAATANARRKQRSSLSGGGVASTILSGGYSPTGQASASYGG